MRVREARAHGRQPISESMSSTNEQHVYMHDNADPSLSVPGGQATQLVFTGMKTPSWEDWEQMISHQCPDGSRTSRVIESFWGVCGLDST